MVRGEDHGWDSGDTEQVRNVVSVDCSREVTEEQQPLDQVQVSIKAESVVVDGGRLVLKMEPNCSVYSIDKVVVSVVLGPVVDVVTVQVLVVHVVIPHLSRDRLASRRITVHSPESSWHHEVSVRVQDVHNGRVQQLLSNHEQALVTRVSSDVWDIHKVSSLHHLLRVSGQEDGLLRVYSINAGHIGHGG